LKISSSSDAFNHHHTTEKYLGTVILLLLLFAKLRKPLAATAGAMILDRGGNAVDAACAMLTASCTMWDVLSWGGETQALIYNPNTKKVIADQCHWV
jgi:hypothetical protein